VSSSFGQFDYAGFPKSASYWYRALWLAAADAENDYGRPPLPAAHVVRISQSWQPRAPGPPPPLLPEGAVDINLYAVGVFTPVPGAFLTCYNTAGCDVKAFLQLCPNAAGKSNCLTCARAHNKSEPIHDCEGFDVWPTICSGAVDPEGGGGGGRSVQIQVYSDLPLIELVLNSESQGTFPCTPGGFAAFSLPKFEPGNLTAAGMMSAGGEVKAFHTLLTAGPPVAIELSVDVPSAATGTGSALVLDGHDSGLIRASLLDKDGLVSDASSVVTFSVTSGPGRISGVHNGDAKSHEPQASSSRRAYHGLVRAAVKVTRDTMSDLVLSEQIEVGVGDAVETVAVGRNLGFRDPGIWPGFWPGLAEDNIVVTATSPGLKAATVMIRVSADEADSPLAVAGSDLTATLAFD
jgi:hypothetical protein